MKLIAIHPDAVLNDFTTEFCPPQLRELRLTVLAAISQLASVQGLVALTDRRGLSDYDWQLGDVDVSKSFRGELGCEMSGVPSAVRRASAVAAVAQDMAVQPEHVVIVAPGFAEEKARRVITLFFERRGLRVSLLSSNGLSEGELDQLLAWVDLRTPAAGWLGLPVHAAPDEMVDAETPF